MRFTLALVAALLAASCGNRSDGDHRTRLAGPEVFDITMTEYRFAYGQAGKPVRSGRAVFKARNTGTTEHELIIVRLPDDAGGIEDVLRAPKRRALEQFARLRRPPGATATVALDLTPGRYALVCFVKDADGRSHSAKGMISDVHVVPQGATTTGVTRGR